jgi:hypothetical protein
MRGTVAGCSLGHLAAFVQQSLRRSCTVASANISSATSGRKSRPAGAQPNALLDQRNAANNYNANMNSL